VTGYALAIDGLVVMRKGNSLLTRDPAAYVGLFLISAPAWWLFELINSRTQNWFYTGREWFTDLQYFGLASLSFSTVMPAVFGTAELVSTFERMQRPWPGPKIRPTPGTTTILFAIGWAMLAFLLLWPAYFFPFVWVSVYFIIEPLNVWLKHRTLLTHTAEGNWQPVKTLWVGCLICGLFWEFWNFYSYPKWIYQVPFVDFLHIFEMPLLGYGGYLPFALELFALYHLVMGFLRPGKEQTFIHLTPIRDDLRHLTSGRKDPARTVERLLSDQLIICPFRGIITLLRVHIIRKIPRF
jgi:hypothetical protein